MEHDIVYILRNGIDGEELKYSLRSLKNFPHGKVWFFGGTPAGLKPDGAFPVEQRGVSVWQKVRWTMRLVCRAAGVSSDFWLFNDDFFVMKKAEAVAEACYDRTIFRRVEEIRRRNGGATSLYTVELERTRNTLQHYRHKTLNYATHTPMLINKDKMLEVLDEFPRISMPRCLYGNYYNVGGVQMKDCKIIGLDEAPSKDAFYLSTSDESFAGGKVGEYIRSVFTEPSRFEVL